MRYEWKDDYLTGNPKIDKQHKRIFKAANLFYQAVQTGQEEVLLDKAFDLLIDYTNTHFSDEEDHYHAIGSSLINIQIEEHKRLLDELRELWHDKRVGSEDAALELDTWMELKLIPHIIAEDTKAQKG